MKTFELTEENECNNCRRKVEVGESMSAESDAVLKNKGALCSDCCPVEEKQTKIKKAKE